MNLIPLLFILLVISCGQRPTTPHKVKTESAKFIFGKKDWIECKDLPEGPKKSNARGVGKIDTFKNGKSFRCTAFLVAPDIIMTNNHCVSTQNHARNSQVNFTFEKGRYQSQYYKCPNLLVTNKELDFTLLHCPNRPGEKYGYLELSESTPNKGESIYVIHQNCDYRSDSSCKPFKKFSPGQVVGNGRFFSYNADTLKGSSGAPVFSGQNKVVAINNVGLYVNGPQNSIRPTANSGISMNRILPYLRENHPEVRLGKKMTPIPPVVTPSRDPFESNDTPETAKYLDLNANESLEITHNDKDFFKIKVPSSGEVKVNLKFRHSRGDIDLFLYDKNGKVLLKSETTTDNESLHFKSTKGVLYLLVNGYEGATNTYSIKLGFKKKKTSKTLIETSKNHDHYLRSMDLKNLEEKIFLKGSIRKHGEDDYYKVRVKERRNVAFSIKGYSGMDVDLFVYDQSGELVGYSEKSAREIDKVTVRNALGRYYILVRHYKGPHKNYSLLIK